MTADRTSRQGLAPTEWTLDPDQAHIVKTCAAATALGFAFGSFVTAYVDPVAIGWPLTPFIGAFWGCLVGGATGGLLRFVLSGMARGGQVRGFVVAVAVLAVAGLSSVALSWTVASDGQVSATVLAVTLTGSGVLSAGVIGIRYALLARAASR